MQVKIRWTTVCIWLAASGIAIVSCLLARPAAHIGSEYFPVGNDSFYHSARILDAVRDPAAFYEFDPKIHAPEGSLLVWPWGYDFAIAKLVRTALAMGADAEPLTVLLWIPVVAVCVGIGLLMLVARRLSLGNWPTALAALCMALNQGTQILYGFGEIDHHYAEHIFILASLAAGLAWLSSPGVVTGIALGSIFGVALGIHNGLFILQVPLLTVAVARWFQGEALPKRPVIALVLALMGSALAMLIPSQPFQEGRFEFYTLSWFHLYIVCCTSFTLVFMAWLQPSRRTIAALVAISACLLLPLLQQIRHAESFVSGSLGMLDEIIEMRQPLRLIADGETAMISGLYSLLIWLSPVTFLLCLHRMWTERRSPRLLFWVASVIGLVMLSTQLRMHYFGSFALYLPWLIVAQEFALKRQELYKRTMLIASLLLVIAYIPVIRHALIAPVPRAADRWFYELYPVFSPLREACAEDPGIVLADTNAGHYIRYFSDCSVIANNFLLTEQQFSKVAEARRLFTLPPDELVKQAPLVKYVLVRAGDIRFKDEVHFTYEFFGPGQPVLADALLLGPAAQIPPEFKLLFVVNLQSSGDHAQTIPYAKLYKIDRRADSASAAVSSANDVKP